MALAMRVPPTAGEGESPTESCHARQKKRGIVPVH